MKRIAGSVRSVKNRSGGQSIPGFLAVLWFVSKLSLFLSLPMVRRSSLLTGEGGGEAVGGAKSFHGKKGLDFYMSLWIRRLYYTSGTQIRICAQNLHLSARFWSFVKSYCWYKMSGQRRIIFFGILRSCYWHRYPKNYFKRNQGFFSVPYGMWVMWLVNILFNVGQFILFYKRYHFRLRLWPTLVQPGACGWDPSSPLGKEIYSPCSCVHCILFSLDKIFETSFFQILLRFWLFLKVLKILSPLKNTMFLQFSFILHYWIAQPIIFTFRILLFYKNRVKVVQIF
jgi:hypothetical protein